jgi:hypothetical protein
VADRGKQIAEPKRPLFTKEQKEFWKFMAVFTVVCMLAAIIGIIAYNIWGAG